MDEPQAPLSTVIGSQGQGTAPGAGLAEAPRPVTSRRSAEAAVTSMGDTALRRLELLIQQNPWPALVAGVGVGYFLARRMRVSYGR